MLSKNALRITIFSSLLLLSGCFGDRVVVVETDRTPYEITDTRPIKIRYIDPNTQTSVEAERVKTGDFGLSPTLYRDLVRTAINNTTPATTEKK